MVSWFESVAFCRWLSQRTGSIIRLPTEWEWQQAAKGGDPTRTYPWGGEWDPCRCNSDESGLKRTSPVGVYPSGATQHGVLDIAGNVYEWCLNKVEDPQAAEALTIDHSKSRRAIRGGSWYYEPEFQRSSLRDKYHANLRDVDLGFRLAQDIS